MLVFWIVFFIILISIFLAVFSTPGGAFGSSDSSNKHLHVENREGKFIQADPHDSEGYDCNDEEYVEDDPITRYK